MMNKLLLVCMLLTLTALGACGSKVQPSSNVVSRTITLGDFDQIDTKIVKVVYSVGAPGTATLSAPDNVIGDVVVTVRDGELDASVRDGVSYEGCVDITLTVQSSGLRVVECAAGGSVTVLTPLSVNGKFEADLSSAGKLEIGTLSCSACDIEVSSAAKVKLEKLTATGVVDLDGSSAGSIVIDSISGDKLKAEVSSAAGISVNGGSVKIVDLDASSAGSIKVAATFDTGKASASSSAKIRTHVNKLSSAKSSSGGSISNL